MTGIGIQKSGVALMALAVGASLLAGCGAHHRAAAEPTTTMPPPTTVAPTTTTAPPPMLPLSGLAPHSAGQLRQPAVVVKIDNVDAARPQTGINQADLVYEEEVEGGLTRLAAVFQSEYPAVVGPVRSGRLTDEGIADNLNHPVYAYSGTNGIFEPILRAQPVTAVDAANHPEQFYRVGRNIPHNLFASVVNLAKLAAPGHPAPPMFAYLPSGRRFGGAGSAPVGSVSISFPAARVSWTYSPGSKVWLRVQNGTADVDSAGRQADATNIVILFVNYVTSGMATGEGVAPAPIPDGVLTGSGSAWVLSAGRLVRGSWNRTSVTSPEHIRDASGATIRLRPGRTWIELVPTGVVPAIG